MYYDLIGDNFGTDVIGGNDVDAYGCWKIFDTSAGIDMERGKMVDLNLEGSNAIVVSTKDVAFADESLPVGSQRWLHVNTVGRVNLQSMVFKYYLVDTEKGVRNCSI
ncbi:hypothetical protein SADUNF_Sadunf02G0052500 [Salix dunnii]|uniref:Uncharacterized protein n=1 Tax=Salix dunnii TaxID=1413687 RepID=A0A835N675_9ROSI|nr:hypothetical protein SADUNF_Sadunf02G0052500 [Salix dunnii]